MWGNYWSYSRLTIHCGHYAVVQVRKSHKSKDHFAAKSDRNIWLLTAKFDISLQVHHIKGEDSIHLDLLSRLHSQLQVDQEVLHDHILNCIWVPVPHHMIFTSNCRFQCPVYSAVVICIRQAASGI